MYKLGKRACEAVLGYEKKQYPDMCLDDLRVNSYAEYEDMILCADLNLPKAYHQYVDVDRIILDRENVYIVYDDDGEMVLLGNISDKYPIWNGREEEFFKKSYDKDCFWIVTYEPA